VDSEVVALDEAGRPSFNALQNYSNRAPLLYYAFDLLAWRGKNVRNLPLIRRREFLRDSALAGVSDPVRYSGTRAASATEVIEAARRQGLESIVAKRVTSVYEPGKRSGAWVKFKVNKGQELIVAATGLGKTTSTNSRSAITRVTS
jgi:bifunctional non-homologous end joining protein LigD